MKCFRCQRENRPGAKFCEECATPLALICTKCGSELSPMAKFCPECAHSTGVQISSTASARFGAPESYTPKHLAERILTSKTALEGERKQVTVLFADMKGSMELVVDRDPEEARNILDPVLELMMEAVHRYEGTVNQVMGDGIMALFGAPVAHEDHAVRACYAALKMQESIKGFTDRLFSSHGVVVEVRVGLNSGDVVVRSVGGDLRMDYSAVGQTTHLAARMEQLASPGSILLTSHTLDLVKGYVEVKPRGRVPVKGLAAPVEVSEVTGPGPVRSRFAAAALRGLTRFIGREAELDQLHKALEAAGQSHGQIVAVVGEPGVGKSRLFFEFIDLHRTQGWLVLEGGSVSYGKATTYRPVIDLLKSYFQIEPRDDARKVRERVSSKLIDELLLPMLPVFLALLDVTVEDPEWQALDPPQRRQRTLEAVQRLLLRESQVQPLLLVFEDLHWIDSETQAVLDAVVESLPTARTLLLVNYRPEYRHGWGSKSCYHQLQLDPLPPQSAQEVLDALLGTAPGLGRLKELLIERTGGNPFFLEEGVRTLADSKALIGERSAYSLARPVDSIQVPATVHAVLAARIDRLPPDEKRLLQSASVIGHEASFVLLQAIADLPDENLRQGLSHLQAAEFVYATNLFRDLEYTFKHALTHEVVYGGLLQDRRRAMHARIVETLEQLYAGRLVEHVERLAHHALRGEVWGKALSYLRQASAKAAAGSAHREAVALSEQGLEALKHLPSSRERLEHAIDLRFDLRTSLATLGEFPRILNYLHEAEDLATTLGDQRRLGRVCAYLADCYRQTGDYTRAIEAGQRALLIAEEHADVALQVATNIYFGQAHFNMGLYRSGSRFLSENVAILVGELGQERLGLPYVASVHSRTWLTLYLAELGEFAEGIRRGEESLQIAESVGHPFSLTSAYWGLGHLYLRKGDLSRAIPALEHGLELSRVWNVHVLFPPLAAGLGSAYSLSGRVSEAVPLLEQAAERQASIRRTAGQSARLSALSHVYLLGGRMEDASQLAARALDLSREHNEVGNESWALWVLAEIASRRDPLDLEKAEHSYRQSLAQATLLEMRPLVARCHVGLGAIFRRTGSRSSAEEHLAEAIALFRDMDMAAALEHAQAERKALL